MKKLVFVLALFLISSYTFSQTFTFERISPTIVVGDTSNGNSELASYGLLKVTGGTMNIRIIRTIEDIPEDWIGTAMCNYQNCYANTVDTIVAPYGPAAADDTVSFHFYFFDEFLNFVPGAGMVRIRAESVSNPSIFVERIFRVATPTAIGIQQISSIVKEFSLSQNYPNPFNPNTKINFSIPKGDHVSLRVYDMLGREVSVLVNGLLTAGEYQADFNAKGLSSGMYYYSLRCR